MSDNDGILATTAADWFVALRFWIGLGFWPDDEQAWLAHFHHHSFAWLQRLSATGKRELDRLVCDFHSVLTSESTIRDIAWYHESDMRRADAQSSATPSGS